jgi:O-acetyl-ADP-ribose deacetylase (regulator of RNase III)
MKGAMKMTKTLAGEINGARLELVQGDIVLQAVDAIVNAANSSLLGGGGVDGAIHRAAGPQLLEATRQLGGCNTGGAKITDGFDLKARYVIHAVGPVYRPNSPKVAAQLTSAYRISLELAVVHQLETVALPAISTGVYRYPLPEAAAIALQTTVDFLAENETRQTVRLARFVLFTEDAYAAFESTIRTLSHSHEQLKLEG